MALARGWAAALRPSSRALGALSGLSLRSLSTLVLAEHKGGALQPSTLHTVAAAAQLGGPLTLLVAGDASSAGAAAQAASRVAGVAAVLAAEDPCLAHGLAEPAAALLAAVERKRDFSHVLAASSSYGRNVLPRAAALLDVQAVADVSQVLDPSTFLRPIYAGNALATVRALGQGPRLLTVRTTAFAPAPASGGSAPVEAVAGEELAAAQQAAGGSEWVGEDVRKSDRPELAQARVVVAGGRALKSADNFRTLLGALADRLGGAVGASRAAVDAGYAPNDLQVGQTGKVVAPDLYIAVGISGAIQHVAGMSSSKVIVAINSDGEAPIYQVADYGLVGDLFKILPELEAELAKLGDLQ
ncbi:hypothetical protein ABPG75_013044 [Micractinium tetrahymenae]